MIYYIIPFSIWLIFCIWKALHVSRKLRFIDYVFALPLVLLAVLRGDVGSDTGDYIGMAQNIILLKGQGLFGVEFGYVLLVRLMAAFTSDPRLIIAVISLLAAILLLMMLHMWENGQCIVSLVLISAFFFVFTMNGLRIGIAYPMAAISILQLEKKRFSQSYILAIAAISIQMSAAILLPMLLLARRGAKLSYKVVLYCLITGASILYLVYYIFGERVSSKLLIYSISPSPTSNSGVGPLLISFVCCVTAICFSEKRYRYLGITFFLIQIVSYMITQSSYAGLRFQTMALFAQLLALSFDARRPIKRGHFLAVLLLCCLAFSEIVHNFISSAGEQSAFIPYHFVWEDQ